MRTNLNGIKRVRFNDYSEYDSAKCNNGGCYGFWTDYNRLENGLFEVSYGTTADFEYCPICGDFGNHFEDSERDYGSGCSWRDEAETITEEELLKLINSFEETEDEYIEYYLND